MPRQKSSVPPQSRSRRGTREQPSAISDRIEKSLLVCRETELKSKNIKVRPPAQDTSAQRNGTLGSSRTEDGDEGPSAVRYLTHPGGRRTKGLSPGSQGASGISNATREPEKKRTSVRLPLFMWEALEDICRRERMTLDEISQLIGERIEWTVKDRDERRSQNRTREGEQSLSTSLSTAIRIFILAYYRALAEEMDRLKLSCQAKGGSDWSADDVDLNPADR